MWVLQKKVEVRYKKPKDSIPCIKSWQPSFAGRLHHHSITVKSFFPSIHLDIHNVGKPCMWVTNNLKKLSLLQEVIDFHFSSQKSLALNVCKLTLAITWYEFSVTLCSISEKWGYCQRQKRPKSVLNWEKWATSRKYQKTTSRLLFYLGLMLRTSHF